MLLAGVIVVYSNKHVLANKTAKIVKEFGVSRVSRVSRVSAMFGVFGVFGVMKVGASA